MERISSLKELIAYHILKFIGRIVRVLPLSVSLAIGRFIGSIGYYFDIRHKSRAYANLKMAFAGRKSSGEIKKITKDLFKNYGQNLIELLRMPLMNKSTFEKLVEIEGKENIDEALKKGKGCILLAMHFGSWEIASLSCAMLDHPYKVMVKPQDKFSRLDELLNSYRSCGGSVVLSRGMGTRDLIKSLQNNEVLGMVVDQGGRDGVLVPFFHRQATMSSGAIRIALKMGVPLCFSIIIRGKGGKHRMIIHSAQEVVKTGNMEADIVANLVPVVNRMEEYITQYPSEYMWFYKIWKYSKEAHITILFDGKVGHLRQSETVARSIQIALLEREIKSDVQIIRVEFKNKFVARSFSLMSLLSHPLIHQGRLEFFKWLLTEKSFNEVMSLKTDFIVSCGSSIAGINHFVSHDHNAKSVVILKPGLLNYGRFDLVVLPQHDAPKTGGYSGRLAITNAAPNLVTPEYLEEQKAILLDHFSHLKNNYRTKIGVFIGGDSNNVYISEDQIRILSLQLKDVVRELNASLIITTSRRTPEKIEKILMKNFKKNQICPLLIIASKNNVPEAVGGILGISDIVVVSGDSISMVSEAAASGKDVVVFYPQTRAKVLKVYNKHKVIIERLNSQGYIRAFHARDVGHAIYDISKNKITTKSINDNQIILDAVRKII